MSIKATYRAPAGDSEVVTMRGVRFFDGQAVEVDDKYLAAKLKKNPHFDVDDPTGDMMAAMREAKAAKKTPTAKKAAG